MHAIPRGEFNQPGATMLGSVWLRWSFLLFFLIVIVIVVVIIFVVVGQGTKPLWFLALACAVKRGKQHDDREETLRM